MTRNEFTPTQTKWLEALESGKHKQIRQHLCADGMCCLGVATYVVDPMHAALRHDGWCMEAWSYENDVNFEDLKCDYGVDECTAPPDVVDALHLYNSGGGFRFGAKVFGHACLISLNDEAGLTFAEIAAVIREKPWLVFTNFDAPKVTA